MNDDRYLKAVPGFTDAVAKALELRTWAILGTEDPDGSVQMTPLMFLAHDNRLLMQANSEARKVTNLRARPRATVLIETKGRVGWVAAKGTAEIVEGDAALPLLSLIEHKYMTDEGVEIYRSVTRDDTVMVVTPTSWRGWSVQQMSGMWEDAGLAADVMAPHYHPLDL